MRQFHLFYWQERGHLEEYEMKDLGRPVGAMATQRMPEALDGVSKLCPEELKEIEVQRV